jgi:hypothetical protein
MPTITALVKTKDHYGIGAICCGPPIISDNLLFIPPNIFGSIQATFSKQNCDRVKDHFINGGKFNGINNTDTIPNLRQYVFFINDEIWKYTGGDVKDPYEINSNNIVVSANRIGENKHGFSLFKSLMKNYSDDVVDCIIKSFRENKHIGFDRACQTRGISSTTLHISVYKRDGERIFYNEIYSPNEEPLDQI